MDSIVRTDFDFKNLTGKYTGKVRDVYFIQDKYMHSMWYCLEESHTKDRFSIR